MKNHVPLLPRIFAVLASALLVSAVALATLLPADMSLAETLDYLDPTLQETLHHLLGIPFWKAVIHPFMIRPTWLIPLSLGLICTGGAITAYSQSNPQTKQKRS